MSPRDDLAARVRSKNKTTGPESSPAHSEQDAPPPAQVRTKPVRMSAHLEPQPYRRLAEFSVEVGEQVGKTKIPLVEIIRALVDRLNTDPDLKAQIAADLRKRHG